MGCLIETKQKSVTMATLAAVACCHHLTAGKLAIVKANRRSLVVVITKLWAKVQLSFHVNGSPLVPAGSWDLKDQSYGHLGQKLWSVGLNQIYTLISVMTKRELEVGWIIKEHSICLLSNSLGTENGHCCPLYRGNKYYVIQCK